MAMFITVTILVFTMASIPLTILSLNIGGSVTLGGLPAILELEKPDIVFLQEVHVNTEALDKVVSRHNYKAMCNINTSDERTLGTAFVWRIGVPVTSVNSLVSAPVCYCGWSTTSECLCTFWSTCKECKKDFLWE